MHRREKYLEALRKRSNTRKRRAEKRGVGRRREREREKREEKIARALAIERQKT